MSNHITLGNRLTADLKVIGISEFCVSSGGGEALVTYSLGSCVGVSFYDPLAQIGGMIHCMLPVSKGNCEKAEQKPAMFVDTGVVAVLEAMFRLGAVKERLVIKVAGAASPLDAGRRFRIGERNYTILRKLLWKNDLMIAAEDIGGTAPRTMTLFLDTGVTTIKSVGKEVPL